MNNEAYQVFDLEDIPARARRKRGYLPGRDRRHEDLMAAFNDLSPGKVLLVPPIATVGNITGILNRVFHQKYGYGRVVHTSRIGANGGIWAWWHPNGERCESCPDLLPK